MICWYVHRITQNRIILMGATDAMFIASQWYFVIIILVAYGNYYCLPHILDAILHLQSTSNYLARRFGVRAAMPGFIAKKLCPGLVIVPASYDKYQAVSKDVRAILSQYDPNMCPMSLDEAYLDITEHLEKRKQFTEEQRTYRQTLTEEEVCTCGADDVGKIPASQMDETTECENISVDSEDREIVTIRCATCSKQKCLGDEVTTFGISAEEAVREMRFRIHAATMITASAGIYVFTHNPCVVVCKINNNIL